MSDQLVILIFHRVAEISVEKMWELTSKHHFYGNDDLISYFMFVV